MAKPSGPIGTLKDFISSKSIEVGQPLKLSFRDIGQQIVRFNLESVTFNTKPNTKVFTTSPQKAQRARAKYFLNGAFPDSHDLPV
jgi:hypothetical protein